MELKTAIHGGALRRSLGAFALSLVALLAFASLASASTASKPLSILTYQAAAGESNNVTVSDDGTTLTLIETGANITSVTGGCTRVNNQKLTCPLASVSAVIVQAGNNNDVLTSTASKNFSVYGGDGNDTINSFGNGLTVNNTLRGEAGNDTLVGGDGFDVLLGGDGNDSLDGGVGRDYLYGQAGVDTLHYEARTNPVYVDLNGASGGIGAAEDDDLLDDTVENVKTGSHNDTIIGNDQATNTVWGGAGNDNVTAGSASLTAYGQDGNDSLTGSASGDWLYGNEGHDHIEGGAGGDHMNGQNGYDILVGSLEGDSIYGGNDVDTLNYEAESTDIEINSLYNYAADLLNPESAFDEIHGDIEVVTSGSGADSIDTAGDGLENTVKCKGGIDAVVADTTDTVAGDCENVTRL